jgi:hypothetical protein
VTVTGTLDWQDPRQPQGADAQLLDAFVPATSVTATEVCSPTLGIYDYLGVNLSFAVAVFCVVEVASTAIPFIPTQSIYVPAGGSPTLFFPYGGPIGDVLTVTVTFTPAVGAGGGFIIVDGLRSWPATQRPDGIVPCRNSLYASISWSTPSTTVIPAPGAGLAILVGAICQPIIVPAATLVAARLTGTMQGANCHLASAFATTGVIWSDEVECGPGILMDPNTAVTQLASATPATSYAGGIYYDIVSI